MTGDDDVTSTSLSGEGQRLDKWLWFARVVKSRTQAQGLVTDGHVRVNRERVTKASQAVKPGDVITASVNRGIRILRVKAAGVRRGPAGEAATLYEDLTPPAPPKPASAEPGLPDRPRGTGRPTKRDRRALDRLMLVSRRDSE